MSDRVRRAAVRMGLAATAVGMLATAVRWVVDPSAPSTSCIAGGGPATEAVGCVVLDAVASMALWTVIVVIPSVVIAAVVAAVLERRREQ